MLTTNFAEAGGFIRSSAAEAAPICNCTSSSQAGRPRPDHDLRPRLLVHVCLLQPQSRGSVKLASADPLAAPLIDPAFFSERGDLDRLIKASS